MSPEFSVILPTRGDSSHLRAALASVLASDEPIEVLLVHDRRPEEPGLAEELLRDPRVRAVESSRPGPAAARNRGLDCARGEWIAFQDDDDLWLPGHLAAARERLLAEPRATLIAGDAYLFDDPSADGSGAPPHPPERLRRFASDRARPTIERRELLLANRVLTPTVVLRREQLGEGLRFDESLPVMEDYDLWLRLSRAGHLLLFEPEPRVVVRRRPGSASSDRRTMSEQSLALIERHVGEDDGSLTTAERRQRLGLAWHDLAYSRLSEGDLAGCRTAVARSRRYLPLLLKNYMYVLASLLPGSIRGVIVGRRRRRGRSLAARPGAGGDWAR